MTLALYQRVVLTRDIPEEGLRAGDASVIVEHYPARADVPEPCPPTKRREGEPQ